MAADVVVGVVMVMSMVVGVVHDGVVLVGVAEGVAVLQGAVRQTVVTELLARLVAWRRVRRGVWPGRAGGGAVAQWATLLPALADIRTLLMVRKDIKWRTQTQLKLEKRKRRWKRNFYEKKKNFMVRNKREQADGTLVHLHKSSLGVQDFRLRLDVLSRTAATPEKMAQTVIMMVM